MARTSPRAPRLRKMFRQNRWESRAAVRPTRKGGPQESVVKWPLWLTQNPHAENPRRGANIAESQKATEFLAPLDFSRPFPFEEALKRICRGVIVRSTCPQKERSWATGLRSEEHTSELQSRGHLVCRLLLEK